MTTEAGFRVVEITQLGFDVVQIEIATPDEKVETVIVEVSTLPPGPISKDKRDYLVRVLEAVSLALQKFCTSDPNN